MYPNQECSIHRSGAIRERFVKKMSAALAALLATFIIAALATFVVRSLRSDKEVMTGAAIPGKEPANNQKSDNAKAVVTGQEEGRMDDYQIGRQLGSCLVRGCSVVLGLVQAIDEPQKEEGADDQKAVVYRKVHVAIDRWIWGERQGEDSHVLVVTHAERPAMTKTAIGPWTPWQGVELKPGGRLLVALWGNTAERPTWTGKPEETSVAASSDVLIEKISKCIALHTRLVRSTEELSDVSRLVRSESGVLTAGYLLSYLIEAESKRDVNRAAQILSSLQSDDKLPDVARIDANQQLLSFFNRLSQSTRRTVAEALVITASGDDVKSAEVAISTLVRLSDQGNLKSIPLLNDERRRKLAKTYQAAVEKGLIEKNHSAFESQIGLKFSQ